MKKVLLTTAALVAITAAGAARADEPALQLGLGGYISGYAVYTDQDEPAGTSYRKFDFRKDTELHLSGEVALDNGITAGAHMELLGDRADGGSMVEESYMYLSSSWGRVNFGEEDGAAYLLQVAAPSADDKVDGIRPDIGSFAWDAGATTFPVTVGYAQDPFGYANKFTYITPVFNGFQGGVSYTPTIGVPNLPMISTIGLAGAGIIDQAGIADAQRDDDGDEFDNGWEIAARYEGSFEALDIALGAGYSHASLENETASATFDDDFKMWNAGANLGWGAFGLGVAYLTTNNGVENNADYDSWVVGVDYTTGPYKLGLSYLDAKQETGAGVSDTDIKRWTVGAIYEWGPGMTFRGAVQMQDVEDIAGVAADDLEGTQVTLGTQLNF